MICDPGKPADPTTIEFILPDIPLSGLELPRPVKTPHAPASHAVARYPRHRSMPIAIDIILQRRVGWEFGEVSGAISFHSVRQRARWKPMSSDSSVSPDQPDPAPAQDNAAPPESAVKFTRAASIWTSLTAGFLILIVLLIFNTQNTASVQLAFFGWRWSLPLGVSILLAAVGGGLITVAAGTAPVLQVRRAAKKKLTAGRSAT